VEVYGDQIIIDLFSLWEGKERGWFRDKQRIPVSGKLKPTGYSMTLPFLTRTPKPTCDLYDCPFPLFLLFCPNYWRGSHSKSNPKIVFNLEWQLIWNLWMKK